MLVNVAMQLKNKNNINNETIQLHITLIHLPIGNDLL